MRILSRGTDPKNKLYKGTCSYCKTVFECQQHEGRLEGGDYRSDFEQFLRVNCPVCGKSAVAYERNDGQPIRYDLRTNSLAHQIDNPASQFDR